eukprot:13118794-Ditylum_brightwellii.AAC.1
MSSTGTDSGELIPHTFTSSSPSFDDCMQVKEYFFPPNGNQAPPHITPSHKLGHTFKFRSGAPDTFQSKTK